MKGLSEQVLMRCLARHGSGKRLASCIEKGIAFHHAGLAHSQRKIVEDNFRKGDIKIICCTPTLAFGLNLPAFRAIMKDLKRYGGRWGMQWIPVLEYQQCIGKGRETRFQ
jgi:helicase